MLKCQKNLHSNHALPYLCGVIKTKKHSPQKVTAMTLNSAVIVEKLEQIAKQSGLKQFNAHKSIYGTVYCSWWAIAEVDDDGEVYYEDKSMRIGDHEPNYAMRRVRGEAEYEFYVKSMASIEQSEWYDLLEFCQANIGFKLSHQQRAAIARFRAQQEREKQEALQREEARRAEKARHDELVKQTLLDIIERFGHDGFRQIMLEAEQFANVAQKKSKRNKRRNKFIGDFLSKNGLPNCSYHDLSMEYYAMTMHFV